MNEIEKLEAALKLLEEFDNIDKEKDDKVEKDFWKRFFDFKSRYEKKPKEVIKESARAHLHYKRVIEPLLRELVDVRALATKGLWDMDQGGEVTTTDGTCLLAAPQYNPCPNFIKDALFSATAAEIAAKLKERIE